MKTEPSGVYDPKIIGAWMLVLALFVGQLFFYTWCRVQSIRVGYEISRQNAAYQQQLTVQNTLKIELERLRTPERIIGISRRDLGLAPPVSHQIQLIVLNESY